MLPFLLVFLSLPAPPWKVMLAECLCDKCFLFAVLQSHFRWHPTRHVHCFLFSLFSFPSWRLLANSSSVSGSMMSVSWFSLSSRRLLRNSCLLCVCRVSVSLSYSLHPVLLTFPCFHEQLLLIFPLHSSFIFLCSSFTFSLEMLG